MSRRFPFAVAAVLCVAGLAVAQNGAAPAKPEAPKTEAAAQPKTLSVGDKAPALAVKEFVKGEPITGFEKGKVYVVEFWATWCGPCIAAMPHLSEIQKQYKDKGVTVVGVTSEDRRNTLDKVKKMVADKGDVMGYTVAWDDGRKTYEAFMNAAQQSGIPTSFIVNREGQIAYIGHPMRMDKTLEAVVSGKHDIKAAAASYAKAKENEGKIEAIHQKIGEAIQAGDKAAAMKGFDEWEALAPDDKEDIAGARFSVLMGQFKDVDGAMAIARTHAAGAWKDNAQLQNMIAWTIVDPKGGVEKKDMALAEQCAKRAAELTKNKDAAILDTLARVHFVKGEVDKAIEVQTTAVGLADAQMKADLQAALDEYKAAKTKK